MPLWAFRLSRGQGINLWHRQDGVLKAAVVANARLANSNNCCFDRNMFSHVEHTKVNCYFILKDAN